MNENNYTHTRIQQSLSGWVANDKWTNFTTLTFVERSNGDCVSNEYARRTLEKFFSEVNAESFGKRSKKKVNAVATIEYTKSGNPHFHILIRCPKKLNHFEFQRMVKRCWVGAGSYCTLGKIKNTNMKDALRINENQKVHISDHWFVKLTNKMMRDEITHYLFKTCARDTTRLQTQYLNPIPKV